MLIEQVQIGDVVKIRKPEEFEDIDFFDDESLRCAFLVTGKNSVSCYLKAIDGEGSPKWHGQETTVNPFWFERDEFLTQVHRASIKEKV